jgi:DNA-binding PadR family transcriptional regulator
MELTPTAYVILGMLSWGPMSGYDIKSAVDRSVRFFWAASYGQIYPELRRLSHAGLVEGEPQPQSGRRRTVFSLTTAGRRELQQWLERQPETFETRDEALLKLFFTDAAPDTAAEALDAKRRFHEAKLKQLRAIEGSAHPDGSRGLVLRYGIESSEWMIDWCTREAERLRA